MTPKSEQYFTDTIRLLDPSASNCVVITTAGGKLTFTPRGITLDGPPEAMHDLSACADQFVNHELQLKINVTEKALELIACRGRGRSYHHVLGELPSSWHDDPAFRLLLMNANAKLSTWHRQRRSS